MSFTISEFKRGNILSLVVLGDFNPVVFQPHWMALKGIIRPSEGEEKIELIHSDVVKFKIGDWAQFQITRERFELRSTQDPFFETIRDICIGIFKVLNITPIRAIGINHIRHFTLSNSSIYYDLGNRLVPLNNWKGLLNDPKLFNLVIRQESRTIEDLPGTISIAIQPSDLLKEPNSFMININDHYTVPDKTMAGDAIHILQDRWTQSFSLANQAELNIENILKL